MANTNISFYGPNAATQVGVNHGSISINPPSAGESPEDIARACREALFLTDPESDREALRSLKGQRTDGTCEWIKQSTEYRKWLDTGSQRLWISGGPGTGKTMLSIFLTEELQKEADDKGKSLSVYYFCSDQDDRRNTAAAILRGLLYQIVVQRPELSTKHLWPYVQGDGQCHTTVASADTLWLIFGKVLQEPDLSTLYCVIDGIDECQPASRCLLLSQIDTFFSRQVPQLHGTFKFVLFGREVAGLSAFPGLKVDQESGGGPLSEDLESFIMAKVDQLTQALRLEANCRERVETILKERCEGTFLWIGLAITELLRKKTSIQVLQTLEDLPSGLTAIYERMLLRIEEQRQADCALMLQWVTTACRPLTLRELAAAIKLDSPEGISPERAIRDRVELCESFLKLADGRNSRNEGDLTVFDSTTVMLYHQSIKEFLLQIQSSNNSSMRFFRLEPEIAHYKLADTCLRYLDDVEPWSAYTHLTEGKDGLLPLTHLSIREHCPLLYYAAMHWTDHVRCSGAHGSKLFGQYRTFCDQDSVLWKLWCYLYNQEVVNTPPFFGLIQSPFGEWVIPLLHVASRFGIIEWVRKILPRDMQRVKARTLANIKDSGNRPVLLYAIRTGGNEIIDLLLDRGARVCDMVLVETAHWGSVSVMRRLVTAGGDILLRTPGGGTLLSEATIMGNGVIVETLLDLGFDANNIIPADWGHMNVAGFALQLQRYDAIAQLLLERSPDPFTQSNGTACISALEMTAIYSEPVVRLLVKYGIDVNLQVYLQVDGNKLKLSLLTRAIFFKQRALVRQLLHKGVDVDARSELGTALYIAARSGDATSVSLLLLHGADRDIRGLDGWKPIKAAAKEGHKKCVELLVEHAKAMQGRH